MVLREKGQITISDIQDNAYLSALIAEDWIRATPSVRSFSHTCPFDDDNFMKYLKKPESIVYFNVVRLLGCRNAKEMH